VGVGALNRRHQAQAREITVVDGAREFAEPTHVHPGRWTAAPRRIRRVGIVVNYQWLCRSYKTDGLLVSRRRKRHVRNERGALLQEVTKANERWSVKFLSGSLVSGRRTRVLAIVDDNTREALRLEIDFSLPAARVVCALDDEIAGNRGYQSLLRSDNGPEIDSHLLLKWSPERNVCLHFIAPGKPTQNAKVESLNARIRDEFLNEHIFLTLTAARTEAALWQRRYNYVRHHSTPVRDGSGICQPPAQLQTNYSTFTSCVNRGACLKRRRTSKWKSTSYAVARGAHRTPAVLLKNHA
jgi:putative transposase